MTRDPYKLNRRLREMIHSVRGLDASEVTEVFASAITVLCGEQSHNFLKELGITINVKDAVRRLGNGD